jgi:hypothetical protein
MEGLGEEHGFTRDWNPTARTGLQPPHEESKSAIEPQTPATIQRRQMKKRFAAVADHKTNLIEGAARFLPCRRLRLPPREHRDEAKMNRAELGLARETQPQTPSADLI